MAAKHRKPSKTKKTKRQTAASAKGRATRDEDAFTRSLVAHGQAAKANADGQLPAGATHELVKDDKGRIKAVRRRFSAL